MLLLFQSNRVDNDGDGSKSDGVVVVLVVAVVVVVVVAVDGDCMSRNYFLAMIWNDVAAATTVAVACVQIRTMVEIRQTDDVALPDHSANSCRTIVVAAAAVVAAADVLAMSVAVAVAVVADSWLLLPSIAAAAAVRWPCSS